MTASDAPDRNARGGRMRIALLTVAVALGMAAPAQAGQGLLHMELGDPARSGREVPVVLDGITDTATGELLTPAAMARRLADTGILFIGEDHTDQGFHAVQLQTIRALHEAGRTVLVGLEMFPYTQQTSLDDWNRGRYTEGDFVARADWYRYWGYPWNYYREIFIYAQEQGLRMYAINSPRELVKAVREKGFDQLAPDEAAHLPPKLAPESEQHESLFRAYFGSGDTLHMNAAAMAGLYRAQTMWDATMGWNALQALKSSGNPKAIIVVLIGAGHVTYGLGAERQVRPWYDGNIASLIPVIVRDDHDRPVTGVRASYANFVWGLPRELDTAYPSLGVSLMDRFGPEPSRIIQVERDSVAARAGLRVDDVLLSLDGVPIASETDLRRQMAGYRWGDVAAAQVRRAGAETSLAISFRRHYRQGPD